VLGTDVPRMTVDGELSGSLATRHLLESGRRRIAYVPARLSQSEGTVAQLPERQDDHQWTPREAGLEPDTGLVRRMPMKEGPG
jgi:DNA-binding LacI/PurR family transcriptional regulator